MSAPQVARRTAALRKETIDSATSSAVESAEASPENTPQQSPSSTSLSSLGSDQPDTKSASKLRDAYGNQFELPDFTIKQIREAIPAHCYVRSGARGLAYVARDIVYLSTTFYIWYNYVTPEYIPSTAVRTVLWGVYSMLQGLFATGLWVLAHECGHQSFSPSKVLNDTVGWVLHSALLVPYFSWKISHGKHHKATGNIERDQVHNPKTRAEYASLLGYLLHEVNELTEETPIATALHMVAQQLFGWPVYLLTNATAHNYHERQPEGRGKGKRNGWFGGVNHFDPRSPLYEAKDAKLIMLSDLGLALTGAALWALAQRFGAANLAVWYGLPYLWVNHWLVMITFLQHTDPSLPHYSGDAWSFTRGAAATIDREFGFVGRHLLHGIIETHVLHHYVSTIPFYHADEATAAIRPVMGAHYRSDTRGGSLGFLRAFYRTARWCNWIEEQADTPHGKGVYFYRNRNGLGLPPAKVADPAPASTTQ